MKKNGNLYSTVDAKKEKWAKWAAGKNKTEGGGGDKKCGMLGAGLAGCMIGNIVRVSYFQFPKTSFIKYLTLSRTAQFLNGLQVSIFNKSFFKTPQNSIFIIFSSKLRSFEGKSDFNRGVHEIKVKC